MPESNPLLTKLLYFFEVFMTLFYFAIAIFLFLDDKAEELFQLTQRNRTILAIVILLYAFFKLYRVYRKRESVSGKQDEEEI